MDAKMLTLEEAAERLGVVRMTVYRLVRKGQLRAHRVGRVWRVPEDAIEEYLRGTANAPQEPAR